MFMKKYFRKPIVILLYSIFILIGWNCLAIIANGIALTKTEYEDIYLNTIIKGEVLSAFAVGDGFLLPYDDLEMLSSNNAIIDLYTEAYARGKLVTDEDDKNQEISIYGTSDFEEFFLRNSLYIIKKSDVKFDKIAAIYISNDLSNKYNITTGDKIEIYPETEEFYNTSITPILLSVEGILDLKSSKYKENIVIIDDTTFFKDGSFLHSKSLKEKWGNYNKFEFKIDPKFNYKFDVLEKELKNMVSKEYTIHTTGREFYNVIKPLEDKIQFQSNIYVVINVALVLISSFLCFLEVKREKIELLIRLMHGESKMKVFISEFTQLIFIISFIQLIVYALLKCTIDISINTLYYFLVINILLIAVSFSIILIKEILSLYQDWEG